MSKILIISSSSTMLHGLDRLLHDEYEISQTETFHQAAQLLTTDKNYTCVILDWPDVASEEFNQLIEVLEAPAHKELRVLLLVHETTTSSMDWVSSRRCSALIHVNEIVEVSGAIKTLMQSRCTEPVQEVLADEAGEEKISILFVDDSRLFREKFRRLLTRHGYNVEVAASMRDALTRSTEQHFDIAIIDFFMPNGNGDMLCAAIKQNPETAHITCAILTGTYLDHVITSSLQAGAEDCMFKNEADTLFLSRIYAMSRSVRERCIVEGERTRLDNILDSVGDGVYGVDNKGHITFINPSARRMLGYSTSENLVGKAPSEVFHNRCSDERNSHDPVCTLEKAYHTFTEENGLETQFYRNDGTTIQVELTVRPICAENPDGVVVAFRDTTMRKLLEEELRWQANHDPLTKLCNRKYFEEVLQQEVERIHRSRSNSALLYLDLDRFKYVNDTAGHAAGDQLLREISHHMEQRLRSSDTLARIGGDEFALILRHVEREQIMMVADGYRQLLEEYNFIYQGKSYKINGSIGIAIIDEKVKSAGDVLANADIACHIAKGEGRNQCHVYHPESDSRMVMDMELGWMRKLENALLEDQFILNFQPIMPISFYDDLSALSLMDDKKRLSAVVKAAPMFEVLVRLPDARGEPVSPNAFLPTAERFNMIGKIDRWIFRRALRELALIGRDDVRLTINISAQSICNIEHREFVRTTLDEMGVDPKRVVFEITETCAVANLQAAQDFIVELSQLGCGFALDDFGSGYCSFPHLKNLAVDYIKIEGTFVQGVCHDPMDRAIVKAINEIAHTMNKKTVAEHVEDESILRELQGLGVDYVQGYAVGRPFSIKNPLTTRENGKLIPFRNTGEEQG
ncbi:MAG: EAL domain-containing protein [Chromatiales bacterium]|nr:EAL domain-containing protein [Chromatiales bacterium]